MTSKALTRLAVASMVSWTVACQDSNGPRKPIAPGETIPGLFLSAPVPRTPGTVTAAGPAASPAAADGLVYVSLQPASVPAGVRATIINEATGLTVTTAVLGGGFDPVPLAASIGDTLVTDIAGLTSTTLDQARLAVSSVRPLKVVRTSPPSGGRDVPLNATIVIVFSEPIDSAALSDGSIELLQGTTPVPGTLRFGDTFQLRVEFHPASLLAMLTEYQLQASTAILGVNGAALDSPLDVLFTTGASAPATGLVFPSVSAGAGHTCGVTPAGAAYCWGYNANGQLGDGTTTTQLSAVAVGDAHTFAAVRPGRDHTCAVTPAGAAYCWGYNGSGALGDGTTTTDRTSPVAVGGGLSFAAVSPGLRHTCGVTLADAAYCWGLNADGQLGIGTATGPQDWESFACSPTAVAVGGGLSFSAVSAGYTHTCGVTTAGAAYCWGANSYGQLGDGTTTERTSPVAVAGGLSFAAVSAGVYHTCGVTTAGAAYCWGSNITSQLGIGTATGPQQCDSVACSPTAVAVAGGLSFVAVSAGDFHTCGLTPAGAAYCWGDNRLGALGDGTTTDQTSPVGVAGGLSFAAVSAGGYHTCGVTPAGAAYCWGDNLSGQLGDGTTTQSAVPVKVAGQP